MIKQFKYILGKWPDLLLISMIWTKILSFLFWTLLVVVEVSKYIFALELIFCFENTHFPNTEYIKIKTKLKPIFISFFARI